MKKGLLFLFIASLITLTSCRFGSWSGVKGNGDFATEEREIEDFSRLDVGGAFNVEIEVGDETSLRIETDENLLKYIITEVKGDKLVIESRKNLKPREGLNIYIVTKELDDIDCSGAASVEAKNINTSIFKVDVSGAADVDLEGEVSELRADVSGAASLEARYLMTENVDVDASGAASASVYVTTDLRADASGAASVNYYGDPEGRIKTDVSGAGSIKRK